MLAAELAADLSKSVWGGAWHGPSLREAMEGVTAVQAAARPVPGSHSIGEIVLHAAAWMEEVLSRINGVRHAEPEAGDWSPCADWAAAGARLEAVAVALSERVAALGEAELAVRIGTEYNPAEATGFTVAESIRGVTQHNTYHAGQIILLAKLLGR
jgi:uncharacterized damage-inducible protein DinB